MKPWSLSLFVALCCAAALGPRGAAAAPAVVESFDASTWATLQQSLEAPTAVVFTTTDCVHCPAVIEQLAAQVHKRRLNASVVAVAMDGDGVPGLLRDPHYRPADRLFAFVGQSAPIRYAVSPGWRGMTPYVVFLAPARAPASVLGRPSDVQIDAWVAGAQTRGPASRP